MSGLLGVPVKLIGLWHAGAYDEHDFLGRLPNNAWAREFERSLSTALDINCFATNYHLNLFRGSVRQGNGDGLVRTGWPMAYLREKIRPRAAAEKRKLVLFPHRLAPEKQGNIFLDLAKSFPDYEFRTCQDRPLSKPEYHELLAQSALVFSASLQETLGIGMYEGLLAGAKILAPDRLSYSEMYPPSCLYSSAWTANWDAYLSNKPALISTILKALANPNALNGDEVAQIGRHYFEATPLMTLIATRTG